LTTSFLALYRGRSVHDARLLAVSSDPELLARFVGELVGEADDVEEQDEHELRLVDADDE
jgi:hypothetical protein